MSITSQVLIIPITRNDQCSPGAIILLHAVSSSNTEAMDRILKDLKAEGYEFSLLP